MVSDKPAEYKLVGQFIQGQGRSNYALDSETFDRYIKRLEGLSDTGIQAPQGWKPNGGSASKQYEFADCPKMWLRGSDIEILVEGYITSSSSPACICIYSASQEEAGEVLRTKFKTSEFMLEAELKAFMDTVRRTDARDHHIDDCTLN